MKINGWYNCRFKLIGVSKKMFPNRFEELNFGLIICAKLFGVIHVINESLVLDYAMNMLHRFDTRFRNFIDRKRKSISSRCRRGYHL